MPRSAMTRPRGPLPARVYWTRRLVLLGVAVALVVAVAAVLRGTSDARAGAESAAQVSAPLSPSASSSPSSPAPWSAPSSGAAATAGPSPAGPRSAGSGPPRQPVLARPDGPCADEDVAALPLVYRAVAGQRTVIMLELRTTEAEACTWRASPRTLTLKISSGDDEIWTSRQCPRAVPTRELVVRRAVGVKVGVAWTGRRSDDECSSRTAWALPGWYHVQAAALAGEPSDLQFELREPETVVITRTPQPQQRPDESATGPSPGAGGQTPPGRPRGGRR